VIRVEFHCHTERSFDAVTTEADLATACVSRGIDVVTITEHDAFSPSAGAELRREGVQAVLGCEFTCERGTHIIGLFLERDLGVSGRSRREIVGAIRAADGLVYIPHPFKHITGYFTAYDADELLHDVDMMELFNGGFRDDRDRDSIRRMAGKYGIRLVAGSDSHAPAHVGFYVSEYEADVADDLRTVFRSQDPRLMVDAAHRVVPRANNWLQRRRTYQWLVQQFPQSLKRPVKAALLKLQPGRHRRHAPRYVPVT